MKRRAVLKRGTALLSYVALGGIPLAACDKPRLVELYVETDRDFPIFKPRELTCPAGARVRLTFHHAGSILTQSHDWVLVQPGTADAVAMAGAAAGEENNWLKPGDPRVIAATPLIAKGGTAVIEFTAPVPGDYPFICTTPGHAENMNGILHVTRL
jgi:azurin